MRLILLSCAIGLVVASHAIIAQAPAGNAQVVGRVIDADTNMPIEGVRVMVGPVFIGPMSPGFRPPMPGTPGGTAQGSTDSHGQFVVDGAPVGRVSIVLEKSGFAQSTTETRMFETAAGQSTEVVLSMRRGGVLTGRILDESGEPLRNIRVMALRRMPGRGDRLVMTGPVGSVTNDLGEFRVSSLAPDDYVLAGAPLRPPSLGAEAETTWATTYYPGTTNEAEAQSVTVAQGETVAGLELRMISARAFRVSGIVVDDAGTPVADGVVSLSPVRPERGSFTGSPPIAHTKPDGTFTIGGVLAGSYVVTATRLVRRASGATATVAVRIAGGGSEVGQEVRVDGADVTALKVIVATPR